MIPSAARTMFLYLLIVYTTGTWLRPVSPSLITAKTEYNSFDLDEDLIRVVHPNGFVNIDWGLTLPEGAKGVNCTEGDYCLDFEVARVVVTQEEHCHKVSWVATNLTELKDCVIIDGHWYGGGEQDAHSWPLENVPHFETPFAIGHGWLQCLAEAYWVSSQGAAIRVEEGTPLFVSLPDHNLDLVADRLCLSAKHQAPFSSQEGDSLNLTYYVCTGNDVKEVHTRSYSKFFQNPSGMPDLRMLQDPIWSTWAEYHKDINETRVREFAANIKEYGFNYSQIEIDDNWETCYGDLTFDPAKFPDPKKMVDDLHSDNFRVTLWTHPFINDNCDSFHFADEKGYLIKNAAGLTEKTTWWNGKAGMVDFTNEEAVSWWSQRLETLRETLGVDSFKFDAGEASFLPKDYVLNAPRKFWPNIFTVRYAEAITKFGEMAEIKIGMGTQIYPNFMRLSDKDSIWEGDSLNGLRSIVPSTLNLGLVGYPFVLPDMIGGNAYHLLLPSPELFVRWVQANALLPGLQFSIVPWKLGDEVVQRSQEAIALHEKAMSLFLQLAQESIETGAPIARPTWWLCPELEACLTANQQFLLGDDVLVTPVVHKGATTLSVALPPGQWKRADTGDVHEGPSTIILEGITTESLVYFTREV